MKKSSRKGGFFVLFFYICDINQGRFMAHVLSCTALTFEGKLYHRYVFVPGEEFNGCRTIYEVAERFNINGRGRYVYVPMGHASSETNLKNKELQAQYLVWKTEYDRRIGAD